MISRNVLVGSFVWVLLLTVVFGGMYVRRTSVPVPTSDAHLESHLLRGGDEAQSSVGGKFQLVVFLDLDCASCTALLQQARDAALANPDTTSLSIRYASLHPASGRIARILEASRKQGRYWNVLDVLLPLIANGSLAHLDSAGIWRLLATIDGLNVERLMVDVDSPAIARTIAQDAEDAEALSVQQVPAVFVNARRLADTGNMRQLLATELTRRP